MEDIRSSSKMLPVLGALALFSLLNQVPVTAKLLNDIQPADQTCLDTLRAFALFSSNFTYCTIVHARPLTLCTDCVSYYVSVREVYNDISYIQSEGGELCKFELENLDRLQVLETGLNFVQDLWNRASCDSCFVPGDQNLPSSVLDPVVIKILNASADLNLCIDHEKNSTGEICSQCQKPYQRFNHLYDTLKETTGKITFCMDVVDLVNRTRRAWSDQYNCSIGRGEPEIGFLLSTSAVTLLSIAFYALTYTFSGKKEHYVLQQNRWIDRGSLNNRLSTTSVSASSQ